MGRDALNSLIEELNTLCEDLHEDYQINYGGCCFVAYILMKNFESIGIRTELVIEDGCNECDDDNLYQNVKQRNKNCGGLGYGTCTHYFIYVPSAKVWVNSEDCDEDDMHYFPNLDSKDVHWIYKTGSWNSTFYRKHRPMIGRRIKQVFDKYEDLYKERDSYRCS